MNDLQNQLAELRRQQTGIGDRINAALIAGSDTGPIRAEASALGRDISAVERAVTEAAVQREAASHSAIFAAATVIAADTENAIVATMARLAAPEHP